MRARVLSVLAAALVVAATASPALAATRTGGRGAAAAGYDISYPQCNGAFPTNVSFGIVGVNDGIVLSANPCLGTGDGPSELAWAQAASNAAPAFYANTGDPGPGYSSHWPDGQSSPQSCSSADDNSTACSYDYGWNAAQNSFGDAVTAEEQVNADTAATATAAADAAPWWLDVETGNSWETLESGFGNTASSQANDTAALEGEVAALQSAGVTRIGFYSTTSQWDQITGGTGQFAQNPVWLPGYSSLHAAQNGCTTGVSFTGGAVAMTQYRQSGFDGDYRC